MATHHPQRPSTITCQGWMFQNRIRDEGRVAPCKPNEPVTVRVTDEKDVAAVGVKEVAEAGAMFMSAVPTRWYAIDPILQHNCQMPRAIVTSNLELRDTRGWHDQHFPQTDCGCLHDQHRPHMNTAATH
eukprot:3019745-Rhodomonas_salina.2